MEQNKPAWNLDISGSPEIYSRNTIQRVFAEIRFDPIIKIQKRTGIPEFQDQIREMFPKYEEGISVAVEFNPQKEAVNVTNEPEFSFSTKAGEARVGLSASRLVIESRDHRDRFQLQERFCTALNGFLNVYKTMSATRFGIRYYNVVDPKLVGDALGQQLSFTDLIEPEFLKPPNEILDINYASFEHTMHANQGDGLLSLRYGTLVSEPEGHMCIKIDIDRSTTGALEVSRFSDSIIEYAIDIYALYERMITDRLRNWLRK